MVAGRPGWLRHGLELSGAHSEGVAAGPAPPTSGWRLVVERDGDEGAVVPAQPKSHLSPECVGDSLVERQRGGLVVGVAGQDHAGRERPVGLPAV